MSIRWGSNQHSRPSNRSSSLTDCTQVPCDDDYSNLAKSAPTIFGCVSLHRRGIRRLTRRRQAQATRRSDRMVMVVLQLYPVIPAASEEERQRLRPIGRNRDLYQETIRGWSDIIHAADELGVWGVATIEHHFWSEGYEVGPSPGVLNAFWAATTKNVRVGQLGYVMSTQNPIRVAEETAVLDHLTRGRFFVGFARGYQSRWTNVLGQHLGTRATTSPSAAKVDPARMAGKSPERKEFSDDEINRRIFEEEVDIVVKAWTEDSIEYQGHTWQIPYPHDKGVDDWPLANVGVTGRLGAPGE